MSTNYESRTNIRTKGFTLIEMLVFLFIFSVSAMSFYGTFRAGISYVIDSKNRLGAVELANEKMEIIRNLGYSDVGTKVIHGDGSVSYGVPAGEILQDEDLIVNTRSYHAHTDIRYHDDPFDGTISSDPPDTVNNDYKKVRIDITWPWENQTRSISLVSNFVPEGVETTAGGGTMVVNISDNQGNPIPMASVRITNSSISPAVEISTTADDLGSVLLPGMPNSENQNTYVVRVSKSSENYETLETLPIYPDTPFDPIYYHAMVLEGELADVYMEIDKAADLEVNSVNPLNETIGSVEFTLKGGRKIGMVHAGTESVYSVDGTYETNSSGEETLEDIAGGVYGIDVTAAVKEHYALIDTLPVSPFNLEPGADQELLLILADKNVDSLVVKVTDGDAETPTPIAGASVTLKNDLLVPAYEEMQVTNEIGRVYFPGPEKTLEETEYHLEVQAAGYSDYSTDIEINGLVTTEVEL